MVWRQSRVVQALGFYQRQHRNNQTDKAQTSTKPAAYKTATHSVANLSKTYQASHPIRLPSLSQPKVHTKVPTLIPQVVPGSVFSHKMVTGCSPVGSPTLHFAPSKPRSTVPTGTPSRPTTHSSCSNCSEAT